MSRHRVLGDKKTKTYPSNRFGNPYWLLLLLMFQLGSLGSFLFCRRTMNDSVSRFPPPPSHPQGQEEMLYVTHQNSPKKLHANKSSRNKQHGHRLCSLTRLSPSLNDCRLALRSSVWTFAVPLLLVSYAFASRKKREQPNWVRRKIEAREPLFVPRSGFGNLTHDGPELRLLTEAHSAVHDLRMAGFRR